MSYISKIFKSRGVICEMLESRGYDIEPYRNFSVNELEAMLKGNEKKTTATLSAMDMKVVNKFGSNLYVKYLLNTKLRPANMNTLIDEMIQTFLKSGDEVVFVLKDKVSNMDSFNSLLDSILNTNNIFIQLFCLDSLTINVLKHRFQPKMRIISPEEKEQVMNKYSVNPSQMPKIFKSDACGKYLGIRKGDVVEIVRASETAGKSVSYRICVS